MDFIYPKDFTTVFLPKDFDEVKKGVVFKVAHQLTDSKLFWYLNDSFLGTTQTIHHKEIYPEKGIQTVTVLDELGNEILRRVEVK